MPAPQLSVEDAIALGSKAAIDSGDQQLVNVMADIAQAYGDDTKMMDAVLGLHDYLLATYGAGQTPPIELLRADHALQQAVGGVRAVSEERLRRQRANQPAPKARPEPPRPQRSAADLAAEQERNAAQMRHLQQQRKLSWEDAGYDGPPESLEELRRRIGKRHQLVAMRR